MTELKDKVALVTGASSGIGVGIVKVLLDEGMKVVGLARRIERVEDLAEGYQDRLFPIKADVTDRNEIDRVFTWIRDNLGHLHVVINNAGVSTRHNILELNAEEIEKVINTNLLAVTLYTRKAIETMIADNINGTIININSVGGHFIIKFPGATIYQASKFGLTAFTEGVRKDLAERGSKIRISSISPGLVASEMSADFLDTTVHIQPRDVGNSVRFILAQPPEVHIAELIIRPTGEIF